MTTTMRTSSSRDDNEVVSPTKSGQSSGHSSVLERARAYNRRIEDKQRSKSLDRSKSDLSSSDRDSPSTQRSQSVGRSGAGNRVSTRERAMASVRNEESPRVQQEQAPPVRKEEPKPDHEEGQQVVTPELLVDALSGHEDGLLAIAERLMEHYDSGYDVMGEAIIDAFADVQKLFQHVVEAAHMEGAAFEASRREQEMQELREQAKGATDLVDTSPAPLNSAGGPTRHDEFIDQDVKDVLSEAIRKGAPLRDKGKHSECFELYEAACQSASSLLPVDSDHRGRLQLSIARSESMSADRACAILRYAMDDVLRSGLRAGRTPLPDVSKRSDSVLPKPKDHPSLNGSSSGQTGVVQSSEEALASLVEEMKEVMGAPVYDNTPLQDVAKRFWVALSDAQRSQLKNEEKLEQDLAALKGEYLLARAEWEEKLNKCRDQTETYKRKYLSLKETSKADKYMEHARVAASRIHRAQSGEEDDGTAYDSVRSRGAGPGSVASIGSGLAQSARSIAGSAFNCAGVNDRSTVLIETEIDDAPVGRRGRSSSASRGSRQHSSDRSASASMGSRPSQSSSKSSSVRRSRSNRSFREV